MSSAASAGHHAFAPVNGNDDAVIPPTTPTIRTELELSEFVAFDTAVRRLRFAGGGTTPLTHPLHQPSSKLLVGRDVVAVLEQLHRFDTTG